LGGFILLPFGIFSKTSFMAERPLGYVVAAGLKVLALAIVVSGAHTVFAQLIPSPEPDIYEALTILTASIILAMLSIFAPSLAAALVSGGPALGAGALSVGGLAVGAAGGAAITGTMAAGGAAAGAASQIASSARAAAGAGAGTPRPPRPSSSGPSTRGPSGGSPTGGASTGAAQTSKAGTSISSNMPQAFDNDASSQSAVGASAAQNSKPSAGEGSAYPKSGKNEGEGASPSGFEPDSYPKGGKNLPESSAHEPKVSPTPSTSASPGCLKAASETPNGGGNATAPTANPSAKASLVRTSQQATSSAPRYHRFPAHSPQGQGARSKAFNAYFAANTARQLMPANENTGTLNLSIREED
ncbi:MAG: hypothetical protein CFE32_18695, partial [Alphaproteobacteria bacterium PA3]